MRPHSVRARRSSRTSAVDVTAGTALLRALLALTTTSFPAGPSAAAAAATAAVAADVVATVVFMPPPDAAMAATLPAPVCRVAALGRRARFSDDGDAAKLDGSETYDRMDAADVLRSASTPLAATDTRRLKAPFNTVFS